MRVRTKHGGNSHLIVTLMVNGMIAFLPDVVEVISGGIVGLPHRAALEFHSVNQIQCECDENYLHDWEPTMVVFSLSFSFPLLPVLYRLTYSQKRSTYRKMKTMAYISCILHDIPSLYLTMVDLRYAHLPTQLLDFRSLRTRRRMLTKWSISPQNRKIFIVSDDRTGLERWTLYVVRETGGIQQREKLKSPELKVPPWPVLYLSMATSRYSDQESRSRPGLASIPTVEDFTSVKSLFSVSHP